jgi:hypothetical protein
MGREREGRGEEEGREGKKRNRDKGGEAWEILPGTFFRKVGAYGYYLQ